jgi:hypothetical protein
VGVLTHGSDVVPELSQWDQLPAAFVDTRDAEGRHTGRQCVGDAEVVQLEGLAIDGAPGPRLAPLHGAIEAEDVAAEWGNDREVNLHGAVAADATDVAEGFGGQRCPTLVMQS